MPQIAEENFEKHYEVTLEVLNVLLRSRPTPRTLITINNMVLGDRTPLVHWPSRVSEYLVVFYKKIKHGKDCCKLGAVIVLSWPKRPKQLVARRASAYQKRRWLWLHLGKFLRLLRENRSRLAHKSLFSSQQRNSRFLCSCGRQTDRVKVPICLPSSSSPQIWLPWTVWLLQFDGILTYNSSRYISKQRHTIMHSNATIVAFAVNVAIVVFEKCHACCK